MFVFISDDVIFSPFPCTYLLLSLMLMFLSAAFVPSPSLFFLCFPKCRLKILSFISYLQPALVTSYDLEYQSVTTANHMASCIWFWSCISFVLVLCLIQCLKNQSFRFLLVIVPLSFIFLGIYLSIFPFLFWQPLSSYDPRPISFLVLVFFHFCAVTLVSVDKSHFSSMLVYQRTHVLSHLSYVFINEANTIISKGQVAPQFQQPQWCVKSVLTD